MKTFIIPWPIGNDWFVNWLKIVNDRIIDMLLHVIDSHLIRWAEEQKRERERAGC